MNVRKVDSMQNPRVWNSKDSEENKESMYRLRHSERDLDRQESLPGVLLCTVRGVPSQKRRTEAHAERRGQGQTQAGPTLLVHEPFQHKRHK